VSWTRRSGLSGAGHIARLMNSPAYNETFSRVSITRAIPKQCTERWPSTCSDPHN